jgi:hypothetical protein
MKIKLSKSQWEFVGKQAGWMKKTADSNTLEMWIERIIKNPDLYSECPPEFKNHPEMQKAMALSDVIGSGRTGDVAKYKAQQPSRKQDARPSYADFDKAISSGRMG